MIDPKRVARELAKEIMLQVVGNDNDRAEMQAMLEKMITERIAAEYVRHIENIEKVTGRKVGA